MKKNITIMRFTNRYVVSSIISTDRKKRNWERERERERWNEDSKIFHVVNLNWLAYLWGDHAGMILLFRIQNE